MAEVWKSLVFDLGQLYLSLDYTKLNPHVTILAFVDNVCICG